MQALGLNGNMAKPRRRKRIGCDGEPRINLLFSNCCGHASANTNTHKLIQHQRNSMNRVETHYTRTATAMQASTHLHGKSRKKGKRKRGAKMRFTNNLPRRRNLSTDQPGQVGIGDSKQGYAGETRACRACLNGC